MDEHELITSDNIITNQAGGAALAPIVPNYIKGEKTDEILFEILNTGINDIILNIKSKLGSDYDTTSQNAADIMNMLESLQSSIATETNKIGHFPDSIGIEKNAKNLYNISDDNFVTSKLPNIYIPNITTLDTPNETEFEDSKPNKTATEIQTRLNNCHILEMLYLIKHEEVMKTFAFTLNLFDKYKYSIKLLLFVLKFLVVKKKPEGSHAASEDKEEEEKKPCLDVKLPKTLIPNIQTLLQDQKKVQNIIADMKKNLEANPLGNVQGAQVLNPADGPDETELNTRLKPGESYA